MELDVLRAWKDEMYYDTLSEEEQRLLPDNPAGTCDLEEEFASFAKPPTLCNLTPGSVDCTPNF